MKPLLIIANWKSNKTAMEAEEWIREVKNYKQEVENIENKEVIICPPFTLLPILKTLFLQNNLKFKLGAQDMSPFDKGAYTGEINARQIKEFAEYVIIGHSERRQNFNENDKILGQKVEMAANHNVSTIYCVQNILTSVPKEVKVIAYEPIFAIGSGKPDTPQSAKEVSIAFKEKSSNIEKVIYGGSVTSENVNSFTKEDGIDGVLIGGASLNPQEFIKIIKNA